MRWPDLLRAWGICQAWLLLWVECWESLPAPWRGPAMLPTTSLPPQRRNGDHHNRGSSQPAGTGSCTIAQMRTDDEDGADMQLPSGGGAPSRVHRSSRPQLCLQQPDPRLHGCTMPEVAWSTLGGGRGGRASWCFRGPDSNKSVGTQEPHSVTWIKQIGGMPSVAEGSRPHQSDLVIGLILSSCADHNEKAPGIL